MLSSDVWDTCKIQVGVATQIGVAIVTKNSKVTYSMQCLYCDRVVAHALQNYIS